MKQLSDKTLIILVILLSLLTIIFCDCKVARASSSLHSDSLSVRLHDTVSVTKIQVIRNDSVKWIKETTIQYVPVRIRDTVVLQPLTTIKESGSGWYNELSRKIDSMKSNNKDSVRIVKQEVIKTVTKTKSPQWLIIAVVICGILILAYLITKIIHL